MEISKKTLPMVKVKTGRLGMKVAFMPKHKYIGKKSLCCTVISNRTLFFKRALERSGMIKRNDLD
eukprot:snap_masked-scaffold_6-processed-gene-14.21-mRNA-1 protein AED:1.00 eAED:1.00 QI:0/0/0/0/1/1/2/0/64